MGIFDFFKPEKRRQRRQVRKLIGQIWNYGALPEVWVEAAANIGEPAVGPLIKCLRSKNSRVRGLAAWALGEIGDVRALTPLLSALKVEDTIAMGAKQRDINVMQRTAWALGRMGEMAIEPLTEAMKSKDRQVAEYAAGALGWTGSARAIEPLIHALRTDTGEVMNFRLGVMQALEMIGEPAIEPLTKTLLEALVVPEHPSIRRCIVLVLGKIGDERARDVLLKASSDGDREVREYAREALTKLTDRSHK